MSNPKPAKPQKSSEMPWQFFVGLGVFSLIVMLLTLTGVLDFSDKPGHKRGLLVIMTGLHEIFGLAGPSGLLLLLSGVFLYTGVKQRRKALAAEQKPE